MHILMADFIASFEKYLQDNWPDPSVEFVSSGAFERGDSSGSEGTEWMGLQMIGGLPEHQPMRAAEEWAEFNLRLVCFSRKQDRLGAVVIADQFKEILRNSHIPLLDRTDSGATQIGNIEVQTVEVTGPGKDARGIYIAACEVGGWVLVPA